MTARWLDRASAALAAGQSEHGVAMALGVSVAVLRACLERKRAYQRAYQQRPEVKERQRAYQRAYRQRPEVKEQRRAYQRAYKRRFEFKLRSCARAEARERGVTVEQVLAEWRRRAARDPMPEAAE